MLYLCCTPCCTYAVPHAIPYTVETAVPLLYLYCSYAVANTIGHAVAML